MNKAGEVTPAPVMRQALGKWTALLRPILYGSVRSIENSFAKGGDKLNHDSGIVRTWDSRRNSKPKLSM